MPVERIYPEGGLETVEIRWNRLGLLLLSSDGYDSADGVRVDGVRATLDRAAVNKIIRTLRKARDQAFGADA